jgi:hypothetical protein
MPPATPRLEVAVVWSDPDLQELVVSASSASFSGQVSLYVGWKELEGVSDLLQGFPRSRDDKRVFAFGQDNLSSYGTASFTLYCKDSTGHAAFEVVLSSNPHNPGHRMESAVVIVSAVVGDIDRFAAELRAINNKVGASAVLQSAA